MKILFVDTYYPQFMRQFAKENESRLPTLSYVEHLRLILDQLFGDSDFYSEGMRAVGHEAWNVIVNDEQLQKKWAKEQGGISYREHELLPRLKYFNIFFKPDWVTKILEAQMYHYNPDIIYFQNIEYFPASFLARLKKRKKFIIAQKASPVRKMYCFKYADLTFTSFPHFVEKFKRHGVRAEYLKLAFSEKVLSAIPPQQKMYECTFIGGVSRHHKRGLDLLSTVNNQVPFDIFGYGKEELDPASNLYKHHHGEIWGKEMYRTMMQSFITLNRHIDVAENFANNMRLYEATGCGAMLITDQKDNLGDIFEVGKEVVVYTDAKDLIEKIKWYESHPEERDEIAQAGQQRILKSHTYTIRMKEAWDIIQKYLS